MPDHDAVKVRIVQRRPFGIFEKVPSAASGPRPPSPMTPRSRLPLFGTPAKPRRHRPLDPGRLRSGRSVFPDRRCNTAPGAVLSLPVALPEDLNMACLGMDHQPPSWI